MGDGEVGVMDTSSVRGGGTWLAGELPSFLSVRGDREYIHELLFNSCVPSRFLAGILGLPSNSTSSMVS